MTREEMEPGPASPTPTKPGLIHTPPLGLFQGFGVEVEMMIARGDTLDVAPVADLLLSKAAGEMGASEVERGSLAWSNELVLHVLEIKTNGPAPTFEGLSRAIHADVQTANDWLEPMGCLLLPGAMHPWMAPDSETRIWPHEFTEVYRTFDRIFGCRGHGWSNLQSTHLNLPFASEAEFVALHSAIRALLPLLPALSAASPILDGVVSPVLDARLVAYRDNARRVPTVTGRVVPDAVESIADYGEHILEPIYRDLAPLDPHGILRHEWVNARGAIARFQRGAIEIRTVDAQEAPAADLAVLRMVVEALQPMVQAALDDPGPWHRLETEPLALLLEQTVAQGPEARVADRPLRSLLELPPGESLSAGDAWTALLEGGASRSPAWISPADSAARRVILQEGPLARRILRALGDPPPGRTLPREALRELWRELAGCLAENRPFRP